MERSLKGKKLLVLGGSVDEIDLVLRAQELGVYVIVSDYYEDMNISPAKLVADEVWNTSWMDVDAIVKRCIQSNVDGVTAGYSEIKIDMLIRICERLGLPCYVTAEQLEITRDKVKFKEVCRKNGVPVVKEYASIEEVDSYPVIVKPVDRGGSIGISVANNVEELKTAYSYALSMSLSKNVIIEKFIQTQKMDVYYAIEDGVSTMITSNDALMAVDNGSERVIQSSWLYPHKYETEVKNKVDASLKRMIADMGIHYGCIFFSGFVDDDQNYAFFECGFRLEGGHQYEYALRRGYMDFNDIFIFHALTGSTEDMPRNGAPDPELKMVTLNFYAKAGTVATIKGVAEIAEMENCTLALVSAYPGEKCDDTHAILKKLGMFSFVNHDPTQLKKDADRAYSLFDVRSESGEDMIYDRIETTLIPTWWN